MDWEALRAIVHGFVKESYTTEQLNNSLAELTLTITGYLLTLVIQDSGPESVFFWRWPITSVPFIMDEKSQTVIIAEYPVGHLWASQRC